MRLTSVFVKRIHILSGVGGNCIFNFRSYISISYPYKSIGYPIFHPKIIIANIILLYNLKDILLWYNKRVF